MKKKLILTESQYEKVRLLKEGTDIVSQFEAYCIKKAKELGVVFFKLKDVSVQEILESRVNIDGLTKYVNSIEDETYKANKRAYDVINTMPDADDLDLRLDNAYSKVSDKASSLNLLLYSLEKIQNDEEEHKLSKSFEEERPLDISGLQ